MPKSPQEKLFDFLLGKGLTCFLTYEDYQRGTERPIEKPQIEIEQQLEKISIDLEAVENEAEQKRSEKREAYKIWKDEMPDKEKLEFNEAFNEDD